MSARDTRVRNLLVEHIAEFAENLFESTDEQSIHNELNRFLAFFCGALEAAERDGRNRALIANMN